MAQQMRPPSIPSAPPNQTAPTSGGEPPSALLRRLIIGMPNFMRGVPMFWRNIPHNAIGMPARFPIPPNMFFPMFRPNPALRELYNLYYGTRR